jgi:hypothetical protein
MDSLHSRVSRDIGRLREISETLTHLTRVPT